MRGECHKVPYLYGVTIREIIICLKLFCLFFITFISIDTYAADEAVASINVKHVQGHVNRMLLGNSIWLRYRNKKNALKHNRRGGGIWDPIRRSPQKEFGHLIQDIDIKVLRWPGGRGLGYLDWKKQLVGPYRISFGLPEYLEYCAVIGAEPVITLSAEFAEQSDIEAIISYLNMPFEDVDSTESSEWAKQRSQDGRPDPWMVTWFEFGNETFNTPMSTEEYIAGYRKTKAFLRSIAPYAKLGAVLQDTDDVESGWTFEILKGLGNEIDFGIIHPYIPSVPKGAIERYGVDTAVRSLLQADANFQYRLDRYREVAEGLGITEPLMLAVTELNAHLNDNKPVPMRHTLAAALHNADFLLVMLLPKNKILFSNYHQLVNAFWGMLAGYPENGGEITKRPNYYVYKIFNDYLLDEVVKMGMDVPVEELEGFVSVGPRISRKQNDMQKQNIRIREMSEWSRRYFSGGEQTQSDGIISVNFLGDKEVDYHHATISIPVIGNTLYRVSAQVRTIDLRHGKVGIAVGDGRGWKKTFSLNSNTPLTGTQAWQWITVDYRTLSDATKMRIIARKFKRGGKTSGRAEFGKVKVERLAGILPPAKVITGIATVSENNERLSLVLLNKSIDKPITITLNIDEIFSFEKAEMLSGDSALATSERDDGDGKFWLKNIEPDSESLQKGFRFTLPEHSLTAIMFSRH